MTRIVISRVTSSADIPICFQLISEIRGGVERGWIPTTEFTAGEERGRERELLLALI